MTTNVSSSNTAIPETIHPHDTHSSHISDDAVSRPHSGGSGFRGAEEFKAIVEAKGREFIHAAEEKSAQIKAHAETAFAGAKVRAEALRHDTEGYVRENPLTSVCIALGAGFVVGLVARR